MEPQDDKNLFASKFLDFGAVPSDTVWKGIEAALPEKRKKRILIWWWTSGFAAVLLVALILVFGFPGENGGQMKNGSGQHQLVNVENPANNTSTFEDKKKIKAETQQQQTAEKKYEKRQGNNVIASAENRTGGLPESSVSPTEEHVQSETTVKEKSAVLLPKRFDLWKEHSAVNRYSPADALKSNDKNKINWWIGVMAEQSNRFSPKTETTAQPVASYSVNKSSNGSYYWSRNRNLQLNGGFYWRKWSFGTGFEYSRFDKLEGQPGSVIPGNGRSFGVPVFVAYQFYSNRFFNIGLQFDARLRYISYRADSLSYNEVISTPADLSPENMSSVQLNGFQAQAGLGLFIDVPLYNRFHWNTVVEYQHSGYTSSYIRQVVNGSWIGARTGIHFTFRP